MTLPFAAADQPPAAAPVHLSDTESDYGSVTSAGIQGAGQEDWRDLLIRQGVSIALVTFTRPGANSKEMSVVKGDYLEVTSKLVLLCYFLSTSILPLLYFYST